MDEKKKSEEQVKENVWKRSGEAKGKLRTDNEDSVSHYTVAHGRAKIQEIPKVYARWEGTGQDQIRQGNEHLSRGWR